MNKCGGGRRAAMLIFVLSASLAGCSNKPPSCSDAEVGATAKQLLSGLMPELAKQADDPDGLIAGYFQRLRVELVNVVDNGYDDKTHKQSCAGTLRVKAEDAWGFERQVSFWTQRLVDDPKAFQLEMTEGQLLAVAVQSQARTYYEKRRWSGEWSGSYACQGVDGATEGPASPFSMPATLVVDGDAARLERTTRGGGVEKLAGTFSHAALKHGILQLSGEGMNSPDDKWRADFQGEAHGREAVASGELRAMNGALLRHCELKLTQAAVKP